MDALSSAPPRSSGPPAISITRAPNPSPPRPLPSTTTTATTSHPVVDRSPPPPPLPVPPPPVTPPVDKFSDPDSEASRAIKAAQQWNALLKWDRTTRLAQGGPRGGWDYATGLYHVPRASREYYSNVERLALDANGSSTNPSATSSSNGLNPSSHPFSHAHHPTQIVVSSNSSALDREIFGDSDDEGTGRRGGGGGGYHDSGRPRRSRQAMTRG
ncbi:hypothetical protein JCM10212_003105 [Sporobolomyces blumeae]